MDHPTPEALRAFVLLRLADPAADQEIREHLEEGCEECLLRARGYLADARFDRREGVTLYTRRIFDRDGVGADVADAAMARALGQAMRYRFILDREAELGETLLAEIERRPRPARREAIRTLERYRLLGFSELLCQESRRETFRDLARARELAELAVEVADGLDPQIYHPAAINAQQALARAFLGNARRVSAEIFEADRAFHEASQFLAHEPQSRIVRAEVSTLLGSLRIDQGRYGEARRVLEEALETFGAWSRDDEVGRVLVKLGLCAGYAGEAERAVELFTEAAETLEGSEDRRLLLQAHHNVALWLVEAGDPLEALARYERTRRLYEPVAADTSVHLRRRWLEARIHAGLGDADTAVDAFEEVRSQAARSHRAYELAMVSLDLALVHLDRGDTARVQELADELAPIFRSYELHRHALGAVYLFQEAARQDRATAELAREVRRYLERTRNNPYARFKPSARWG